MPEGARSFTAEIVHLLPRETNPEAFRFMAYILDDAGVEMLPLLLPFFTHSHQIFWIRIGESEFIRGARGPPGHSQTAACAEAV